MHWVKEDVLLLVDLVRRRPCLYDKGNESFRNEKKKFQIAEELARIISSTRPRTTAGDILQKWAELCVRFFSHHQKVIAKKKYPSKLFYYKKMEFMVPHLKVLINPMSEQVANKENKDKINKEVTENDARPFQTEDKHTETSTSQIKKRRASVSETEESQLASEGDIEEPNRESLTTITVHSDRSPTYSTPVLLSEPRRKSRRKTHLSSASGNTTLHDISCITLPSPLVCVTDSLMDRVETFERDENSFSNTECEDSVMMDDEDMLYSKYIACKLKKLDETKKLKFKLEVEKLFYESMKD